MTCRRCHSPMLTTHNRETEQVCKEVSIIADVFLHECMFCQASAKEIFPLLPSHRETLGL